MAKCKCSDATGLKGHSVSARARLQPNEVKRDLYEGRQVIKVPVVMARSDVVMNGSLLPQEELQPETWDGVPVTWGHPTDGEGFISAQTPQTLSEWSIGRIFNSRIDGVSLRGEAWIEVDRARDVAPGFVESLLSAKGELPIDVSTGYFSKDEQVQGELNGRAYSMINRDVKPNHLAILVGEEGACSWQDGCGLRSNGKRKAPMKAKLNRKQQAAATELKAAIKSGSVDKSALMLDLFVNERGQDDDRRQIVADLISRNESPYTPDDEQSLLMMSDATLRRMRDDYLNKAAEANEEVEEAEEEEVEETEETANAEGEGGEEEDPNKMKDNSAALPKNMGELTTVITKVVGAAIKSHSKSQPKAQTLDVKALAKELAPMIITDEVKAALAFSTNQVKARRAELVNKVIEGSAITREAAEAMDDKTLEVVANGMLPAPSYAGRPVTTNEVVDEDDEAIAAMTHGLKVREELKVVRGGKK